MFNYCFNNFRCRLGQTKNGVQFGGDNILQQYKNSKVNHININKISDYKQAYNIVNKNLKNNIFNINLGGDHSIAVSTIQPMLNYYKKDLLVIWIDAHADINTYKSSITKNYHGMPLSVLTGSMDHWFQVNKNRFILPYENLIYVGIRDLDPYENTIINNNKIANYPHYKTNIVDIIKKNPAKYIHISCDIDSMDPIYTPSTGTIVQNGLSVKNVISIIKASQNRLVGFDLVEFNPLIGKKMHVDKTLVNIYKILNSVMFFKNTN